MIQEVKDLRRVELYEMMDTQLLRIRRPEQVRRAHRLRIRIIRRRGVLTTEAWGGYIK
jgi:hypothetical protein